MDNKKIVKDCISFMKNNACTIINLRTGFGKSKIVYDFIESFKNKKIVILVPKSIILQWQHYFTHTNNDVTVISQHSAAKHKKLIERANIVIIDEPKLLKSMTRFWQFMTTTQLRCEKRILLDATVIENNVGELSCLRAFFPGFTQKDLQKSIFYRKVEMPRNIVRKTVHIVLPDEVKRSMMYGEWLLLEALRGKKKFQIYKYLMENIRKLSSVVDKRDIGWYKVQALESIVTRSDADRGILFATSVASAEACVAELQRIGKRVKAITGKTKMKERHEIRDEFNSYKLDYIVGTRAVERGLDLPSGKAVLHFDTPFSGSAYTQRDRVTRMASYDEKTTTIFTFQIDDSIEELQREIVNAKIATDKNLQNGVVKAVLTTRWTDFMENLIARRRKLCKSKRKK